MLLLLDTYNHSWGAAATAVAAVAAGAVCMYLLHARGKRRSGKLAPGPRGDLPFIGHALYFAKPDSHRLLTKVSVVEAK